MDLNRKKFSIDIAGRPLTIEISRLAEQASGAVMANYGETTVLATVVMGKQDRALNYLPLSVDYEERFYAAGKILGSRFVRREGRPSDESVLSGRLVDRAIRPLFDNRIRRDIQVVITVVSYDEENDPDLVALTAVSTALGISEIPFAGPVSGLRIAKINDEFKINPLISELANNPVKLETFVAGVGNKVLNMIELAGDDASEEEVMQAFDLATDEIEKLNAFQNKIIKEIGKEKAEVKLWEPAGELRKDASEFLKGKLDSAVYERDKIKMDNNIREIMTGMREHLEAKDKGYSDKDIEAAMTFIDEEINDLVHENILKSEKRPDGRRLDQVRDLYAEVGILHRSHGSSIFMRGNTQSLAAVTIAPPGSEQLVESMEGSSKRRFMLHYNFPPFSVGETGRVGAPGRREIGHGKLAEKAIRPLIPTKEDFPYTIRIVSEILSSNGSSSMATVCASSLALMDAGVPIKKPAAGIAMGLMSNKEGQYKVLTDIQGPEDHHGDMDFKAAGTRDGVNAIQMDVKVYGVSLQILRDTLAQAKKARFEILDVTDKVLNKPRPELSRLAPRVLMTEIDPSRIGELVGPGGKVINGLIASTGVTSIDIEQDGKVYVASVLPDAAEKAIAEIKSMMRDFKVGEIVEGDIIRMLEFGAIVDIGGGRDGMVHVSEIKDGFVKNVTDVLKLGEHVRAKIIKVDGGKIGLSIKQLAANSPKQSDGSR